MYEECGRQTFGCCKDTAVEWADDTTMSTYLVNRSSSSAIGFKTPIDTLGNIGFNKSGEYKKTFIGSGVGTGSVQVLQGVKFEVEPQEDHTFEVEPHRNVDHVVASQEVQTHDLIYYHSALDKIYAHELLTFNNTIACEVIFKWEAGLKDDMDARSDIYVLSNGCKKCSDDSDGYYWEYTPAKGNILGLEIIRDQGGNTLRMSQSRIHNEKLVQTLLKGHSTLSLEDSISMECDVEKNASAGVDMLDGFDRGLQTNIQVFMDFDYAMGRSITVISRSITGYELMILGCTGSLKANLQHMEALSTTEAGYVTFTEAWKKEIWLKELLTESRYELRHGYAVSSLMDTAYWSSKTVRIYQKSQENRQNRTSTDTRNGRAQEKPKKQSQSQEKSTLGQPLVNPGSTECMRTRSQARNRNRRQQQLTTVIVEEPEFPMADNRTMAQMLQAPIEGYEDAIVVPPINANNFELKQPLINLVQSNKLHG
ncbi:hypothetical protein Tco_1338892 [Tanacetum coccineum]